MSETNWFIFEIDDKEFSVDSLENYHLLMKRLGELTLEMSQEYPDKQVLITWPLVEL